MYQLGYNINGKSFTGYPARAVPQINHQASKNFQNSDLVNSRIATLLFGFNAISIWGKLSSDKPLDTSEKAELTASFISTTAAAFQIGMSYVEASIGNNPHSRTAIVTRNAFGRLFLWGASLSAIAGAMFAVFDFMDMKKQYKKERYILLNAYLARSLAILTLSTSQFLIAMGAIAPWLERILATSVRRTIWTTFAEIGLVLGRFALRAGVATLLGSINRYATLVVVVVTVVMIILDDDALQKWCDRCCFSKQKERDAFDDLKEELTEFQQSVQGSF